MSILSGFDFDGRRVDVPDNMKKVTGTLVVLLLVAVVGVVVVSQVVVQVPSGYRGVLLTWGKVEDRVLDEGLNFKMPFSQSVVLMDIQIQKAESVESTATKDLQEVSTTIVVNFRLDSLGVNDVYRDLRQDYISRVIKPNIQESLKATTALYRAEELVTRRAEVKDTFDEILNERLGIYDIDLIAVSLTDFQFSPGFMAAIDAKVTAEQQALVSKNELVRIRYEAQQQIIQAEAAKNATIRRAEGEALAQVIAANATSQSIRIITGEMTDEYADYLWLTRWDGKLPLVFTRGENGVIVDVSEFLNTTG